MEATGPKLRGRPRTFNEDLALGALLDTFWTRGFAACTLDELAAAAQVSKPSLYAAFGDKRAMYLRALQRFAGERGAAFEAALGSDRPLAEGLTAFLNGSVEHYMSGDIGPRGCLVLCTAATEAVEHPEIRGALAAVLSELDAGLERRFTAAKASGEISPDADTQALASLAAAALHSLAIRVRAGEPRDRLDTLISSTVRMLAPESPTGNTDD